MILQKSFQYADLVLKKHFLLLVMLKKIIVYIFFENQVFFRILQWIESSKELVGIIGNITNIFLVTFD